MGSTILTPSPQGHGDIGAWGHGDMGARIHDHLHDLHDTHPVLNHGRLRHHPHHPYNQTYHHRHSHNNNDNNNT